MPRINGIGAVTFGGPAQANLASYSVDLEQALEEIASLSAVTQVRTATHNGWTAKLAFELDTIIQSVGAIGIGGWDGVEFSEWAFKGECKCEECSAGDDYWKTYQAGKADWTLDATKWQSTEHLDVFMALLLTTPGIQQRVAISGPFGSGYGLLEKVPFEGKDAPAQEKITVRCHDGDVLTTTDAWLVPLLAQSVAAVASGYATPTALVTPRGSGSCFVKSMEVKLGKKLEYSVDLQGTGAWTP